MHTKAEILSGHAIAPQKQKVTMKIHVLNAIHPYLRMLTSFDAENFRANRKASVLQHIGFALLTAVLVVWVPVVILLGCWQLNDDNMDISQFSAAFPILISYTQAMIMFIVLSLKNREIRRHLNRLQQVINESESNGDKNAREPLGR